MNKEVKEVLIFAIQLAVILICALGIVYVTQ